MTPTPTECLQAAARRLLKMADELTAMPVGSPHAAALAALADRAEDMAWTASSHARRLRAELDDVAAAAERLPD